MSDTIVSFTSPPVVEIVVGVAFDGLSAEMGALLSALWKERLRNEFPVLQQQPPYSPPDEQFPSSGRALSITLNLVPVPNVRLWAQSSDGQRLVQLQPGWFAYNWRQLSPREEWSRWKDRRNEFRTYFDTLSQYLTQEGAGQPKIRQCEVTYINHIFASESWSLHSDFAKIFRIAPQVELPCDLEQMSLQAQFVLEHDNEPYGRLYAKITPAFGPDGITPLYVFELTARGAPQGDSIEGAINFLDLGRRAANRTFVALTTETMHQEWGRKA
jgi:uncharacterized protein (TIGR04255 family)